MVVMVTGEETVVGQEGLGPETTHAVLAAGEQHATHRPSGGRHRHSIVKFVGKRKRKKRDVKRRHRLCCSDIREQLRALQRQT